MSSDNRNDLPPVNSPNFLEKVREALSTYLGNRGDPLNRGLVVRDLADAGLIDISAGYLSGKGKIPPVSGPGPNAGGLPEPDLTPAPMPTGFTATGAISNIMVKCDDQTYSQGHGHAKSRLYGATWTSGDLPVFSNAVLLEEFQGTVFNHATNPATTWRLWLTWVTIDGVESTSPAGGTNGIEAKTGQDVTLLLKALDGQIRSTQLYADLGSRIDLIDTPGTGLVAQVALLNTVTGGAVDFTAMLGEATASAASAASSEAAAILAKSSAQTASASAVQAASDANSAKSAAILAQGGSANSATTASTKATEAAASATNAAGSASIASTSATTASTAATNAGTSASAANTSATNAASAATSSGSSATASNSAKVAAESARDSASGSATAAATSASTATTQATNAGTSSGAANTSALTASTKAGEASTFASNAATSATNAAGSATSASTSAGTATASKNDAATSATNAATSATAASTSASNALGSASAASTSATTAAGSATAAGGSATAAGTSATNAATSATNASNSATVANTSSLAATSSFSAAVRLNGNSDFSLGKEGWSNAAGAYSAMGGTIVAGGPTANSALQISGSSEGYWDKKIPVDITRSYRVRFRVKSTGTTGAVIYAGVATFDANGTVETTSPGTHRYCAAASLSVPSDATWHVYEGIITGGGNATVSQFRTTTKFASPMFIVNYGQSSAFTCQVDECSFTDVTSELASAASASAAATSASTATTKASEASTSASTATTQANTATTQAGQASTSATNAATSETNALGSKNAAALSAIAAANSASAAGGSATASAGSASTASTQATNAATSSTAANTAKVAAESARDAASGSASAASMSASTATTKATDAGTSATAAAASATTASTKSGDASTYASQAATSASNAAGSATTASTQAGIATTAKNDASGFSTNAGVSATNAATSATNAAGSASSAASSVIVVQSAVARARAWENQVSVNGNDAALIESTLKEIDGTTPFKNGALFFGGSRGPLSYRVSARVSATGTPTGAVSIFKTSWNGIAWVWSQEVISEAGNSSNHVRLYLNAGVPTVRLYSHTSTYDVVYRVEVDITGYSESASIQTEATTRATQTGELYAQYTVKLDVGSKVSGYGLASTGPNGAGSAFAIRADRFYVAAPEGSSGIGDVIPFVVQATQQTINGVVVPAGVYMDGAYIKDLTAPIARLGQAWVDSAMINDLSATKITGGSMKVGSYIQSTNYVASTSGWRINADGTAEFSGVIVRGTVYATAGQIGGVTIDSTSIHSGTTGYGTGTGYYLGSNGTLSLGTKLTWDGATLNINGGGTFSGALSAATGTFAGSISAATGTFTGNLHGGQFTTGAFTGWAWPTTKLQGRPNGEFDIGSYVGPSGILLGNGSNGKFVQLGSDGTMIMPGMNIANGVLTISQANVINTLNIAGNAVTVPVSAYTAGTEYSVLGASVQSAGIVTSGGQVFVIASAFITNIYNYNCDVYLTRDSNVLVATKVSQVGGPLTLQASDTPPAGYHTYELLVFASGSGFNVSQRSIFVLETKR